MAMVVGVFPAPPCNYVADDDDDGWNLPPCSPTASVQAALETGQRCIEPRNRYQRRRQRALVAPGPQQRARSIACCIRADMLLACARLRRRLGGKVIWCRPDAVQPPLPSQPTGGVHSRRH